MTKRSLGAMSALALLLGCHESAPLPRSESARQHILGERILSALRHAKGTTADARSDLALALAELVIPGQAPRLRLAVAGDDDTLAKGAATALARITHRRDGLKGLADCAAHDTNDFVRAACATELQALPPSSTAAALPVTPLLRSDDPSKRRAGLRELLADPKLDRADDAALQGALVHALSDADPQVALLASAIFLRRSLAVHPPPPDAAVPDVRTP